MPRIRPRPGDATLTWLMNHEPPFNHRGHVLSYLYREAMAAWHTVGMWINYFSLSAPETSITNARAKWRAVSSRCVAYKRALQRGA